jgi:leucyl-tRNA synthetase
MDGFLVNSGEFSGLNCAEAIQKMSAFAEKKGFGKATVTFRLKDWGISRQRYWGTPIPMVYCQKDGVVPVAERDLPVILPDKVNITLTGGSPLLSVPEFLNLLVRSAAVRAARDRYRIRLSIHRGTLTLADARNAIAPSTQRRLHIGS